MSANPSVYALKGKFSVLQSGCYEAKVILRNAVTTFNSNDEVSTSDLDLEVQSKDNQYEQSIESDYSDSDPETDDFLN